MSTGQQHTAQLNLNFTHACMQAHTCACMFNTCKTLKTGVCMHCCMRYSKHTRHTRDARHELARLGLPYYTCGVTIGTVKNEIQLLCS